LRALCRQIDALDREIGWAMQRLGSSSMGNARKTIFVKPSKKYGPPNLAHVCPSCNGAESGCALCRGQGWITAAMHDNPPPMGSSAA